MKTNSLLLGASLACLCGSALAAPACDLTGLQVAAGYLSFANIVKFFAAVGCALFIGAFLFALRGMFLAIPRAVWKALSYSGIAALCASSLWLDPQNAAYAQFLGAALAAGAFAFILQDIAAFFHIASKDSTSWALCVAAFGLGMAYLQHNPMVAAVGVAGLMALLGFSAFSLPSLLGAGSGVKGSLTRATAAAALLTAPAAVCRAVFGDLGPLEIYWPAIAWICPLIACGGLLIMSLREYDSNGAGSYLLRNALMVTFGSLCVWAGAVHGMSELQRVGGTMMLFWLLFKVWDIPKGGVLGYSFFGAATCFGLYLFAQDVATHPQRWSAFLLF